MENSLNNTPSTQVPNPLILNHDSLNVPDSNMKIGPGISELKNDENDDLKLSYNGPGFPLEDRIYSPYWKPDVKRSWLRSTVSQEAKKTDLKFEIRSEGKTRRDSRIKEAIKMTAWAGNLSEKELEQRHYYDVCAKFGKSETNQKGVTRITPLHCNIRRICHKCSSRYYTGRAIALAEKYLKVAEANDVDRLYRIQLTFSEYIRDQIKTEEQLKPFKKAGNKMLQEFYGCTMKGDQRYLKGNIAITFFTHWYSTHEPWKKSPHLHGVVLPVMKNGDKAIKVERRFSKSDLKQLRCKWSQCVRQVATTLGFEDIEDIPNELVVHTSYDRVRDDPKGKNKFLSHMLYDGRSPGNDLEKAIIGQDLDQNMLMMRFEQGDLGYYARWKVDDYVNELIERLAIKGDYKIFGWLTRFKTDANILGIELEEEKDDFEPIPELTESVVIKRSYKTVYDKNKDTFKEDKRVFVKKCGDPDKPEYWKEVDPSIISGEEVCFGSRKIYRCRVIDKARE